MENKIRNIKFSDGGEIDLDPEVGMYFRNKEGEIFTRENKPPDDEVITIIYYENNSWVLESISDGEYREH